MKKIIVVFQALQILSSEFFPRLFSDNPKFFKTIQIISLISGLIAKLPDVFISAGIDMPQLVVAPYSTFIAVCATIVTVVAQFPNVIPAVSALPPVEAVTPAI